MSRVLILYSNPSDSARLRLDREHRMIDGILERQGLSSNLIKRVHAASTDDFAMLVHDSQFEVVQFSGHGSPNGVFLERGDVDAGVEVDATKLRRIFQAAASPLRVAIFMSCFSASSLGELVHIAPYVITAVGPVGDAAAIEFLAGFYYGYFQTGSVEDGFRCGEARLDLSHEGEMHAVLSRRAREQQGGQYLVQAFPGMRKDSILIDLSEAAIDISQLQISVDEFISILSRKIRVHAWVFKQPRDRVVLSIGPFFGVFSWADACDVIQCHRVLQVRGDADENTCEAWTMLILEYNDLMSSAYRSSPQPADLSSRAELRHVVARMQRIATSLLSGDTKFGDCLRAQAPDQFKVTRSLFRSNLVLAEEKLECEDRAAAIAYVETALSAVHDLIDALTMSMTQDTQDR